ncbi:response regulator transcription factor [Motiliproteus sp. SC1-56]|uniref:response regulator transcription factor n=1 Tax=Motiliproteus sp. SC1-56 TaxID=2799565 RepID=UPI001A8E2364|nr:response regulator transcription factor [Motiliproteus sp. SC1-56]
MGKPKMFWVDLRCERTTASSRVLFSDLFTIRSERRGVTKPVANRITGAGERRKRQDKLGLGPVASRPDLCCFEFDYPDLLGLKFLKEVRQLYPTLPILMLTEYRSEDLALWALRLHVWDLLVSPITAAQVADVAQAVTAVKRDGEGLSNLLHRVNTNCLVPEALRLQPAPADSHSMRLALSFINNNLREKITTGQVAEVCGLGPFTFSRAFKKSMGVTFQEYLQQQRIGEAMRLLQHPSASISDVALLAGFRDFSYFSKVFKRIVGCSPTEFRGSSRGEARDCLSPSLCSGLFAE